ncbi:bacterioferritin [Castellaniella hirudinis]|uniref:bacterioferritin n=1 Tax=Castellaniella hirudinis TaxID=1144617 RepID=UPI0039C02B57
MKGHPEVLDYLIRQLRDELAARDQYFIHSRRYQDMGLNKLFTRNDHEMQEETQHADSLLQRILMLEGEPDMRPSAFTPRADVPGMLRADLDLEYEVRASLRQGIALCEKHGDFVSRDLLLLQLKDTESDHAYWLEQQLGLIESMGLQNYLQTQT